MSGYTSEENKKKKKLIQKDITTPAFIAALSTKAELWMQPKCPSTDEWIKETWDTHTQEYYSAIKKNEILPFAAIWVNLS